MKERWWSSGTKVATKAEVQKEVFSLDTIPVLGLQVPWRAVTKYLLGPRF